MTPAALPFFSATVWISLALVALNLVVYAQTRHHEFVNWDDPDYVTENPHVLGGLTGRAMWWALSTGDASNWHPLTWWSHMLDVQVYGMHAGAHHLTSVLLHIASTLLLFGVLQRMTSARWRSAFVAALFGVHPMHVESVAWVAERKDVLSTLFAMLTLWAYVGYVRQPRLGRYLLVAVCLALGLMAKPMLVTLPFVLLLVDVWPLGRVSLAARAGRSGWATFRDPPSVWFRLVGEKVPLLALALASSVITVVVQRRGGAVSGLDALPLGHRVANALVSYISYAVSMLWPTRLAAIYPYPRFIPSWRVMGAVLILVTVSAIVAQAARRRPYLAVGWFWYLGTLVPVIGLVQVGIQPIADRYTYIPFIGLFIVFAWGVPDLVARWPSRRTVLATAAVFVIAVCTLIARVQAGYWNNSVALWEHAIEVTTENAHALTALGSVLVEQGRANDAIADFSESVRIEPDFAEAHNKLGAALADQGKVTEAVEQYNVALRLKPTLAEVHNNLGNAFAAQRKTDEAIAQYHEALRLKPDYALAHNGLGSALDDQGKVSEAIAEYAEALRIKPDLFAAHNNLGAAFASQGRIDDAIRQLLEALQVKPNQPDIHYNAGILLDRQGRSPEALRHFETALKLNPNHQGARRALANMTGPGKKPGPGT